MKLNKMEFLIRQGPVSKSALLSTVLNDISQAVSLVRWPPSSNDFAIYPGVRKEGTHNGVKPIKKDCMDYLVRQGWILEYGAAFAGIGVGKMDAAKVFPSGEIAVVEWETGNISSSHRALNKMALALLKQKISLGFLILPSREFYKYLTDRVGNFRELEPYFDVYRQLNITNGVLAVAEVEHDRLDVNVTRIPLGTDGRSRR